MYCIETQTLHCILVVALLGIVAGLIAVLYAKHRQKRMRIIRIYEAGGVGMGIVLLASERHHKRGEVLVDDPDGNDVIHIEGVTFAGKKHKFAPNAHFSIEDYKELMKKIARTNKKNQDKLKIEVVKAPEMFVPGLGEGYLPMMRQVAMFPQFAGGMDTALYLLGLEGILQ